MPHATRAARAGARPGVLAGLVVLAVLAAAGCRGDASPGDGRDAARSPGSAASGRGPARLGTAGAPPRTQLPRDAHDLVTAFPAASARAAAVVIDLGTPAARRLLREGWAHDAVAATGHDLVWGLGEASTLVADVDTDGGAELVLRAKPFDHPGLPPQTVAVEIEGREVARVTLRPEWHRYTLSLPAGSLSAPEDRITFRYGRHTVPGALGDSGDRRPLAVAWDRVEIRTHHRPQADPAAETLTLPAGTRLDYLVEMPPGSGLRLEAIEGDGRLAVEVRDPASGRVALHEPRSGGAEEGAGGLSVPLAEAREPGGEAAASPSPEVRLIRFHAREVGTGVTVRRPRIEPPDAADRGRVRTRPRPDVVLYLVDTLRADHVGAYGYDRPTTPEIDAFAAEAMLFEHGMAQTSWTRSAVASLFTGLDPGAHRVLGREDALSARARTLAEILSDAGYQTAGFTTNGNVSRTFGFDQGFQTYHYLPTTADELHHEVRSWLEGQEPGTPTLLFVHSCDPHSPYQPPPAFRRRFAPLAPEGDFGSAEWFDRLRRGVIPPSPRVIENARALYDGEVAFNDREFGALRRDLARLGLYDDALWVFVSDHGEEFQEHHGWEHGRTLHGEVVDVPYVVKPPAGSGWQPTRRTDRAEHVDLLPTVLGALALPVPAGLRGRDLTGPPPARDDLSFASLDLDEHRHQAVLRGHHKLIRTRTEDGETRWALYDRATDPGERRNRLADDPATTRELRAALRAHLDAARRALPQEQVEIPDALAEQLRALGYGD